MAEDERTHRARSKPVAVAPHSIEYIGTLLVTAYGSAGLSIHSMPPGLPRTSIDRPYHLKRLRPMTGISVLG